MNFKVRYELKNGHTLKNGRKIIKSSWVKKTKIGEEKKKRKKGNHKYFSFSKK
jgi:hypothetical protein